MSTIYAILIVTMGVSFYVIDTLQLEEDRVEYLAEVSKQTLLLPNRRGDYYTTTPLEAIFSTPWLFAGIQLDAAQYGLALSAGAQHRHHPLQPQKEQIRETDGEFGA